MNKELFLERIYAKQFGYNGYSLTYNLGLVSSNPHMDFERSFGELVEHADQKELKQIANAITHLYGIELVEAFKLMSEAERGI